MSISSQHYPLLEAARMGDTSALNHLLQLCQPDVRRYAYRHCLASDVDDAVQETLLIVTHKLRSLRAVAAFSGWVFQIVRRECRRLERRLFRFDPYDEEKMEAWLATCPDQTIQLDLVRALESLPENYREVILLRDFHELTIQDISKQLQLTVPATKSRLHRARELVREYLLA